MDTFVNKDEDEDKRRRGEKDRQNRFHSWLFNFFFFDKFPQL